MSGVGSGVRQSGPRWLPRGGELPDADWRPRHRLVCGALALHLPVIFFYALATGRSAAQGLAEALPTAIMLGVACLPRLRRRVRALAASLGLMGTSAVLVQLADGATSMHFHYFVAVALVALYEDWAPYLLAIAFVLVQHAVVGVLAPDAVYGPNRGSRSWDDGLVYVAFVVGASVAQLAFWHYAEQNRARELSYRRELYDGQQSLHTQLRRITATREDLLATVSHEFRTPLTAIRGAALTLRKHRAKLSAAKMDELLDAVLANTDRLSRLLENMLTAAEVRQPDSNAVSNVYQVATEVAMLVHGAHAVRTPRVAVAIDDDIEAVVERAALHQILANLLDNAIVHAAPGSQAIVSGAVEAGEVVITVANEAHGVDATTLAGLFEPFTQGDASITRPKQGAGVGLYVVRRLIEVSKGKLTVHSQPGWVSVEVRLPAAGAPAVASVAQSTETPQVTASG
ncbi:MAG: sensor histidine kinase [Frankiaceae bacterium]